MTLSAAIAVGGTVDPSLASATWVEVYERLGEPTSYRIRYEVEIGSDDFDQLVDARLDAGSVLSVMVPGSSGTQCLVKGPVGSQRVHFEHGGSGSYLEVGGSDGSIALDRVAKSTIWTDVTDSDAVQAILGAGGFVPDVDTTMAGHYETKHALVQRESDLSFVRRLARRNGSPFWVTADGSGIETAHFKPPPVEGAPRRRSGSIAPPGLDPLDLRWDVERPTSVESDPARLQHPRRPRRPTSHAPLAPLSGRDLAAITGDTRSIFLGAPVDDGGDLATRAAGALFDLDLLHPGHRTDLGWT